MMISMKSIKFNHASLKLLENIKERQAPCPEEVFEVIR